MISVLWRKFTAWLVSTPVERERFERQWNLIDRIFKVAGWALIIGAYAALARKTPPGSREQWVLGAIALSLSAALILAVLLPYEGLLRSHPPAPPKGFINRLRLFSAFLAAALIVILITQAIQFALVTIVSAGKLP
jgi:hypothetical protein